MEIQTLILLSPIYCAETECSQSTKNDPFNYREEDGEKFYCFSLDENEYSNFEPDRQKLLGSLVFSADALPEAEPQAKPQAEHKALPAGNYLFAQKRELLSRDEIIDMAVEIQAEGLWRRLKPGKTLYLRYFFEDSRTVTQLYRPYT